MTSGSNCGICKIVGVLVGIGALNRGLVAEFHRDLVAKVLGDMTTPARIVYGVIDLAGLLQLISLVKCCACSSKSGGCSSSK